MSKESSRPTTALVVGGGLALMLAVYVFLPVVFLIPMAYAQKRGYLQGAAIEAFMTPLGLIADAVPVYKDLIVKELDFGGGHGLFP